MAGSVFVVNLLKENDQHRECCCIGVLCATVLFILFEWCDHNQQEEQLLLRHLFFVCSVSCQFFGHALMPIRTSFLRLFEERIYSRNRKHHRVDFIVDAYSTTSTRNDQDDGAVGGYQIKKVPPWSAFYCQSRHKMKTTEK